MVYITYAELCTFADRLNDDAKATSWRHPFKKVTLNAAASTLEVLIRYAEHKAVQQQSSYVNDDQSELN